MKRCVVVPAAVIVIIIANSILFCGFSKPNHVRENMKSVSLNGVAGVVIDQASQRILYSKNGDKVLPMASTTKIITAIVTIESGNLGKKTTVSQRAANIGGSSVGLKKGEVITVEELLYGLMLRSGNDAAIALAEAIGGSVDHFVEKMNDKAIELGLYNTSFTSPHGLDDNEHHTTAEELAKATAYAMKNSYFAGLVATKTIQCGKYGKFNRSYNNINKFIYKRPDADGVKTGFTGKAGKCLVASIKRADARYIAVVFNSRDRWRDADKLVDYAVANYKNMKICEKGVITKPIRNNGQNYRNLYGRIKEDYSIPIKKDGSENPSVRYFIPSTLVMPLGSSGIIGNIVVFINNKMISYMPVYCGNKSTVNE